MVRECTPTRLIDVALNEFGANGLEGASTRRIAAAAGTAMSAITYHYGGKDGLYLAVADSIAARMHETMAEALALANAVPDDDQPGARAALHALLATFADKMLSETSDAASLFIVREQMNPSAAFERLHAGLLNDITAAIMRCICIATAQTDAHRARRVTVTLLGHIVVLRSSRASIARLFDQTTIDPVLADEIKATISANLDAILDRMIAQPEAAA